MQMCKFVVFHSEEFQSPVACFTFGVLVFFANIQCEITNAIATLSQKTVSGVISKFVAFKMMIQIQDYYLRQRHNFPVKAAVGDPLVINTNRERIFGAKGSAFDEELSPPASLEVRVMYYIHRVIRGFHTSIYFYFLPLFYLGIPISLLLASGKVYE